ncbi:uncharacterized protein EV420DRAFT_1481428 [Desarmillaria tabescens]|uniref:Uncharacterized protein n=1 Tax=Armillaria tabescens TaxID=1929756 RepID=A0AA39K6D1_ARMTA|nr:uncharacterized protein EV420DRAFT_1481428 [Desarmillaria tabescens]KAK0455172.1 hypothetical protein EV420DRAFT_1481428 [Desarmillaria tabescens]
MLSKARRSLQTLFCPATAAPASFTPPPENTIIFEVDSAARRSTKSQSAYSYLTSVARYCPRGVGDAVVTKIEFRKSPKPPNHEFILLYVKDRIVPGSKPREGSSLSLDSTKFDYSPDASLSTEHDFFIITSDVNTKRSDHILSTLTFDDDSTFTADEAAMICKIASDFSQHFSHQYARVIYNVIQKTQKGHFTKKSAEDDRCMVSNGASISYFDRLAEIYCEEWPKWMADIEKRKREMDEEEKRWKENEQELVKVENSTMELKQELNRLKEELAMLQKVKDASESRDIASREPVETTDSSP